MIAVVHAWVKVNANRLHVLQYTPHQWFMMQSMSEVVGNVRKQ